MTAPKFRPPRSTQTKKDSQKASRRRTASPSTKLDEDLIEQFCALVRSGLPLQHVCDYLGVSYSSVHTWRARGERALGGGSEEEEIFAEFVRRLRKANAIYIYRRIKRLHSLSRNWVRELAILERRDRPNFSRNERDGGSFEEVDPDERFA